MKLVFSKLGHLREVKRKIRDHKIVSIGVFCSGNGDRSPLAHAVLQKKFEDAGFRNVRVFSFGTSVSPSKHLGPASARTARHAREMGYDLSQHKRRHIGDEDIQREIAKADLLFAISPSHLALAAEYGADEAPKAHEHILKKSWTLKGFATKKEWTRPWRLLTGSIARGLALNDPYFHKETSGGEHAFRRDLQAVEKAAKMAVRRLTNG